MRNVLVVNFKAYEEAVGDKAFKLLQIHSELAKEYSDVNVICAISPLEMHCVPHLPNVVLSAQHVDDACLGAYTGSIVPELVVKMGIGYTLLNHSEHRLELRVLQATIEKCKRVGLKTIVCCQSVSDCLQVKEFDADYIAYEPAGLIGGAVSVAEAEPDEVKKIAEMLPEGKLLIGAGVSTKGDVEAALRLGAAGVLVASAVVKSTEPKNVLQDLLEGFNK